MFPAAGRAAECAPSLGDLSWLYEAIAAVADTS